jgi:hypothetical protein
VPIICLDYHSPVNAHQYAKGERFAFWCKLEEAQYSKIVPQINRELRELTFWLDEENKEKLSAFMRQ